MKVTNNPIVLNNIYKVNKVQDYATNKNNKQKDKVELSELGKYLSKVNLKEETMDMEKINKLKNQIENNTYNINSRELAKKIIDKL